MNHLAGFGDGSVSNFYWETGGYCSIFNCFQVAAALFSVQAVNHASLDGEVSFLFSVWQLSIIHTCDVTFSSQNSMSSSDKFDHFIFHHFL